MHRAQASAVCCATKAWREKKPERFLKRVDQQAELDIQVNAMTTIDPILSPQEAEKVIAFAKEQAGKMCSKLPPLGQFAWLMQQQPHTRHTLLSELEWRVMPALMREQAQLFMRENIPIADVSWAKLSPQAAQRYRTPPHRLSYTDWDSGDEIWLIDVVAPFGGLQQIMDEVRRHVHPGKAVYQLTPIPTDPARMISWPVKGGN